jgi:hypothetical protein
MKKYFLMTALICSASIASMAANVKTTGKSAASLAARPAAQSKHVTKAKACVAVSACGSSGTYICYTNDVELVREIECFLADWCD